MEKQTITIRYKKEQHKFTVTDYPHHDSERCKYKVFEGTNLVATFEPDADRFLHLCQNPGQLENELIHQLAAEIETKIPHPGTKHLQ